MGADSRALDLLNQADKKANSSTRWFSFASYGSDKYEEAGELYQRAANAFMNDKLYKEAGDAHTREAECREKCQDPTSVTAWWNATKAYMLTEDLDLPTVAHSHTITCLTTSGHFRQAADREKDMAKFYSKHGAISKASESFKRAAEWYEQELAEATANGCLKEAADHLAVLGQFDEAIKLYEKVATSYESTALTKQSVPNILLRASLCALAKDPATARVKLTEYQSKQLDERTGEFKFVNELIQAVQDGEIEAVQDVMKRYDNVTRRDSCMALVLEAIQRTVGNPTIL